MQNRVYHTQVKRSLKRKRARAAVHTYIVVLVCIKEHVTY